MPCLVATRGMYDRQTDRQTHRMRTATPAVHACRGLKTATCQMKSTKCKPSVQLKSRAKLCLTMMFIRLGVPIIVTPPPA